VSDKPAVIRAEFTDYRPVKTRKTLILSFEIPAEEQGAAFAALGYPVMGSSIWVAIARLQEGANAPTVPEKHAEPAPVDEPKRKRSLREFPRSQQAAMLCEGNMDFRVWLTDGRVVVQDLTPGYADRALKAKLAITSKRALDTDATKAAAWDALRTDFELRDLVR
jgi:hypothetical protein